MSFENFPKDSSTDPERRAELRNPENSNNNLRNILIAGLIAALLGTWGYIIWDKSKTKEEKEQ